MVEYFFFYLEHYFVVIFVMFLLCYDGYKEEEQPLFGPPSHLENIQLSRILGECRVILRGDFIKLPRKRKNPNKRLYIRKCTMSYMNSCKQSYGL